MKFSLLPLATILICSNTLSLASEVHVTTGRSFNRDSIILIDNDTDSRKSKKDLEKRIARLERAVRQLQDRVFDLENENNNLKGKDDDKSERKFTCYIKTMDKGVFTSTDESKTKAKADAMKKCSAVIPYGFQCDENKVVCGD